MKVGILVESGRDGLEDVVIRRICELLHADGGKPTEVDIVPMDNKDRLIQDCGPVVAGLLASGCDRVIILWDERPRWKKKGEALCWHAEKQTILANLAGAKVDAASIHLVCVEREFESWLLFDAALLSKVLSRPAHPVRVSPPRHPDSHKNPKSAMTTLFRKHGGGNYVDTVHAKRFAECLDSLQRLRDCPTFRRFAERVTGST